MSKDINITVDMGSEKPEVTFDFAKYARVELKRTMNGMYGRLLAGRPVIPEFRDYDSINLYPRCAPGGAAYRAEPAIPALDVPAEPVAPPLPPESASVQMLRKLLVERRINKRYAEEGRDSNLREIENLEREIAMERKALANNERTIAAADAAIAAILADIEKLGGRLETEDKAA